MSQIPGFGGHGRKAALALCACIAFAQCPVVADGVIRSVEPVAGGCRVTLAWDFSGNVESDLIIEERLAQGWTVDDSTVPFSSLDASWFSGAVARFAVKPSMLSEAGSISFTVVSGDPALPGTVAGDWKMYLSGSLRKGAVAGADGLSALAADSSSVGKTGSAAASSSETAVAIASFKVLPGGVVELSYSSLGKSGTLVVEGCEGFGKAWTEVSRTAVSSDDGKVSLESAEVGSCRFFRLKLLTEE